MGTTVVPSNSLEALPEVTLPMDSLPPVATSRQPPLTHPLLSDTVQQVSPCSVPTEPLSHVLSLSCPSHVLPLLDVADPHSSSVADPILQHPSPTIADSMLPAHSLQPPSTLAHPLSCSSPMLTESPHVLASHTDPTYFNQQPDRTSFYNGQTHPPLCITTPPHPHYLTILKADSTCAQHFLPPAANGSCATSAIIAPENQLSPILQPPGVSVYSLNSHPPTSYPASDLPFSPLPAASSPHPHASPSNRPAAAASAALPPCFQLRLSPPQLRRSPLQILQSLPSPSIIRHPQALPPLYLFYCDTTSLSYSVPELLPYGVIS